MVLLLAALALLLRWENALAGMPPSDGNCTPSFQEVYPPKMMSIWHVMEHTDNLMPAMPDCLAIKFGRRCNFNSELRMDVVMTATDPETYNKVETPIYRGDMMSEAGKPFQVTVGGKSSFPPNMMITDLNEKNGCMAAWTCHDMGGAIQKAAWIMCKSPNAKKSDVEKIKENLCKNSEIEPSHFIPTKQESCG